MSTPEERAKRRLELEAELAALNAAEAEATPSVASPDKVLAPVEPAPVETVGEPPTEKVVPVQFPTAGEAWDPTKSPPPDAAVGAENAWQAPTEDATTPPPVSAPTDPAAIAQEAHPEEKISQTTFEVVAEDGSTEKTSPGYDDAPCPVCGSASLKTTNVQGAVPLATLRGDTVNPGDQIVQCESCSTVITAGDVESFLEEARGGGYGETLQQWVEQLHTHVVIDVEEERRQLAEQREQLEAQQQALADREAALQAQTEIAAGTQEGGGSSGDSETEGGGA